ncbi:hypothetical protein [Burkholderia aenigmatica]|uniref:hypothetical protein n=1 Tax=Burkholderia aenigmatica TaxID=2015348 RepID=UPI00264ED2E6|nr:hypothetical protein [Burkholderia aenigmatica]MDN7881417.1 hypothetical protein [Burkholderia aenigmatica]
MKTGISPALYARLQREARALGLTVEALVERSLLALADEIDAQRHPVREVSHGQGRPAQGR